MDKREIKFNGNEIVFTGEPRKGVAGIAPDQPDEFAQELVDRWNAFPAITAELKQEKADNASLRGEVEGLRKALAPFAAAADVATSPGTLPADKVVLWCQQSSSEGTVGAITVADCRAAKAALAAEE